MKKKSMSVKEYKFLLYAVFAAICMVSISCVNTKKMKKDNFPKGTYGYDKTFLDGFYEIIELKNGESSLVTIPAFQGRVMTSSCQGDKGFSFGWINYDLILSKEIDEHFNPFGGEERFWLGPEGGQYSLYFKKGSEFAIKNWYVPKGIDTDIYKIVEQTENHVSFQKEMALQNYSGFDFHLKVNREITLFDAASIARTLDLELPEVNVVGYESKNKVTNTGNEDWKKETGLLSIWMLGMMTPSPEVTVVIPVKNGEEDMLGKKVNDDYFGKISDDRLKVLGDKVFFKADGKSRGKIGISPKRAGRFCGSYDAANKTLTIVECILPEDKFEYVNSAWELQDNPYSGDAINSYNDGPLDDGSQMGPFYEIETSSPALALQVNESYTHTQRTYHFQGTVESLSKISKNLLGVTIEEIEKVF
ncbi:DUF6786 family protein [Saccharicrinis sp. GN24d3]|uniref:DUF6786 family protein n=1 Tax=Saccharicrinis sp. GN24d3 TaxID=3458416 RepID=UPI004036B3CD